MYDRGSQIDLLKTLPGSYMGIPVPAGYSGGCGHDSAHGLHVQEYTIWICSYGGKTAPGRLWYAVLPITCKICRRAGRGMGRIESGGLNDRITNHLQGQPFTRRLTGG